MKASYPDKKSYVATSTSKLRDDLVKLSKVSVNPSYLEIGFNKGYTMATLSPHMGEMYGIDIDPDRFEESKKLFEDQNISNATIFCGNSARTPFNKYDLIFIDANHDFDSLAFDTKNVLIKNMTDKPFFVVYHDYGLKDADVRKFCDTYFSDFMVPIGEMEGWNPKGTGTNGPEAMACAFDESMKKSFINKVK